MTDNLLWVIMSWLLAAAGCAVFVCAFVACTWLTIYMLADLISRMKMIFGKRGDS